MAWSGSKIYAYTVLNSMNKGTSSMSCAADTFNVALYGTGTPVNTGTTLVSTGYAASWNTCTEVTSANYTAGGQVIASPTSSQTTNVWSFKCATNSSWTPVSLTAYGCLIYDATAVGNPGLCFLDFGGAQTVAAGTFTVAYTGNTICTITLT